MNNEWGKEEWRGNPVPALAYLFSKAPMGSPSLTSSPTNESLLIVHKPSHHTHFGGIWDLTQVYLEQKLD